MPLVPPGGLVVQDGPQNYDSRQFKAPVVHLVAELEPSVFKYGSLGVARLLSVQYVPGSVPAPQDPSQDLSLQPRIQDPSQTFQDIRPKRARIHPKRGRSEGRTEWRIEGPRNASRDAGTDLGTFPGK